MASFEKTVILVFVDEKGDKYRVYPKTRADYPISATIDVPEGTTYCRICGTKLSGVSFNELVKITV